MQSRRFFSGVNTVKLASLTVPSLVQNGTVPFVILDCPYYLTPQERDGMVLKWYLNSRTIPIYQWIPPSYPQGLGKFEGRIDLDFEMSSDPYTRHRALYILNPTVEMSGEYTCKVSTVEEEVSLTSRMVVYTPPRNIILQCDHVSPTTVKVSCLVDHAFPLPRVVLYTGLGRAKEEVEGVEEQVERYRDGAWRVLLVVTLSNSELEPDNLFTCEVGLPHTKYLEEKTIQYSTDTTEVVAQLNTFNKACKDRGIVILLLATLLMIIISDG